MAKSTITLPDGISVSISGTPTEISEVLSRLQGHASRPEKKLAERTNESGSAKKRKGRAQITDLIANLIDGGFFKKPKDLAAVKMALEEMGHHYPVTTLSPTLLRQVRNRNLRRLKQDKRWMYTG